MLTPSNFFLLRTPSFPINKLSNLNHFVEQKDIVSIKKILTDEQFLNAIYFSSRYFYQVAKDWLNEKKPFDSNDKVLSSLYKYYIRICTRSTPYGLFAGFSSGTINNENSKIEFEKEQYKPILRTDMLFLNNIKNRILEKNRDKKIIYYPNNTIYKVDEELRFIEWDENFDYEISEVTNSQLLDIIIELAKTGLTFIQIVGIIKNKFPDFDSNDIENYVRLLINNKLLIDNLPPYTTSIKNPIKEIEESLNKMNISTNSFKGIKQFLNKQNNKINVLEIEKLANEHTDIIDDKTQLFQIDLKLNLSKNNINEKVTKTLTKNALDLLELSEVSTPPALREFSNRYLAKFGEKEVSLVRALDPQLGVGYDYHIGGNVEEMPLLKNINFSYKEENLNIQVPYLINLIIKNYINYFDYKQPKTIRLKEEDIKNKSKDKKINLSLCDDYYLFGNLLANSFKDIDNGDFKFYCKFALPIPNMKNMLSRFAYHDENLRTELSKIRSEKTEDFIYAEIVHQPNNRFGNILLRPNFFDYEIPYVSQTKKTENEIDINDIMVHVNENGTIKLRSKSLNKEIRPRFSSAYNYNGSQLSVIKFLCNLQFHDKSSGFAWDWSILNNSVFLPRVEYKNLILTEARWRLEKNSSINLIVLKKLISEFNIPRYCNIKENDNILLLDLNNELSLNMLLKNIKKQPVLLYESLNDTNFISKDQENYMAEFVFPLIKTKELDNKLTLNTIPKKSDVTTPYEFYPGDTWTYFKIYCNQGVSDQILTDVIQPLLNGFEKNTPWFFIRYQDPEYHIRLRIKTNKIEELTLELKKQLDPFIKQGFASSLQIDTYRRELGRYGEQNIEQTEILFYHDSNAIIKFINLHKEMNDENHRWKVAIAAIDIFLDDFEIPTSERILLFKGLCDGFKPEFVDLSNKFSAKYFKQSIDSQLRLHRNYIDQTLRLKNYTELEKYITPFKQRSIDIKPIIPLIKTNFKEREDLLNLLQSYIHMTLNRVFPSKARMHELIIYYFMNKAYTSILYRNEN